MHIKLNTPRERTTFINVEESDMFIHRMRLYQKLEPHGRINAVDVVDGTAVHFTAHDICDPVDDGASITIGKR